MSSCDTGNPSDEGHEHTWIADGESWAGTDHDPSCPVKNADGLGKLNKECIESCSRYRVRRYTCHCGEMKKVRYNG